MAGVSIEKYSVVFDIRFVVTFSMAEGGCWMCCASIVKRHLKVYNQSRVHITGNISPLKAFEFCPSDPEISPDGHLRSPYVKSFSGRTKNILMILGRISGWQGETGYH
jgi:hypothetical protein